MADRGVRRVARRRGVIAFPVTALALIVALALVLWMRGNLNPFICDGECGAAYVTAPGALTSNTEPGNALVDQPVAGSVDAAKVQAAVSGALDDEDLGDHVGLTVLSPAGEPLATQGDGTFVPASTAKLLTGFAALSLIGPQERFTTRVVLDPSTGSGQVERLILVGGGDPYLLTKMPKVRDRAFRADLTTLAKQTAAKLKLDGVQQVQLGFDASLFTGPSASAGWESFYVPDNIVTPVSALWADQGEDGGIRSSDPAASAARIFAGLLRDLDVDVSGDSHAVKASVAATDVASIQSATVAQIVGTMIRTSDNQAAEVMLRHAAIASRRPATFDGGTEAVREALEKAGVDTTGLRLLDGSGLSRDNRVSPTTLAQTLMAAIAGLPTASLVSDLPVSGFDGTLAERFSRSKDAYGLVRAKTGTLTGVRSLAGYALDADGHPVIFALMTDGSPMIDLVTAEAALDRVVAAIATCSCGT